MAVCMSDVFRKKFPIAPEDVRSLPREQKENILSNLLINLALVQDDYKRKLCPPSATIMNKEMTE